MNTNIEMGNIPDEFHPSAIASMLATKKLRAWVFVPIKKKPRYGIAHGFRFDLRFGKESEPTDEQLFEEFGAI